MDHIRISGGQPIVGTIDISGSKNAALPLMAASILSAEPLTLSNIPHLADISTMASLLAQLGVSITMEGAPPGGNIGRVLTLNAKDIASTTAPYDIVRKMRASVLVLGPLVARTGHARVSLPGGCAIGTRPVDLHLKALEALGAEITLENGYVEAHAPSGLKGAEIHFEKVSVGATENVLMAATLAKGETILHNAAREPEITDLAHCLVSMGAKINGIGSERLVIQGQKALHKASHPVVADRIEAGTFAIAAAVTGGDLTLTGIDPVILESVLERLRAAGATVDVGENSLRVRRTGPITPVDINTHPYPGFPTDMQAQFMAMLALAEGASTITETIFENRFMHIAELMRMGANIAEHGNTAIVRGVPHLTGAPVMATDLRASVSLIIAALAAEGDTTVSRVYHLDRGYERIEEKLRRVGARIERVHAA